MKTYVPVTDEMLRNQDPGDWLMARRNYQGWSHSPLTQITRDNVRDLQLVWSWGMNEGQGNEPSPLVHKMTVAVARGEPGVHRNVIAAADSVRRPHRGCRARCDGGGVAEVVHACCMRCIPR